jgi:hypothetical protein
LEKVTVGRGYGDALAGMGIALPEISLPSFSFYRNIMIAVIVIVALACVAFLMYYSKL